MSGHPRIGGRDAQPCTPGAFVTPLELGLERSGTRGSETTSGNRNSSISTPARLLGLCGYSVAFLNCTFVTSFGFTTGEADVQQPLAGAPHSEGRSLARDSAETTPLRSIEAADVPLRDIRAVTENGFREALNATPAAETSLHPWKKSRVSAALRFRSGNDQPCSLRRRTCTTWTMS